MITKEMLERFSRPLELNDVEWLIQFNSKDTTGRTKVLPYITARTCHDRLRNDIGIGNYQTDFRTIKIGGEDGVLAIVKFRMLQSDGTVEWVQYVDGAEGSNVSSLKGALSSGIKRTLATLGLARDLYDFSHVYLEGANLKSIPKWAYPKLKELTTKLLNGEATEFVYELKDDNKKAEIVTIPNVAVNKPKFG